MNCEEFIGKLRPKKVFSSGTVEGFNRKINLVTRKSYGFKSFDVLKIALFNTMGQLPEPEMAHRFFLKRHKNLLLSYTWIRQLNVGFLCECFFVIPFGPNGSCRKPRLTDGSRI
ncbi:MAG: hypothetical protein GKR87_11250 [Kiritimatiellae bacterium]|nr:hypothetical protein [Kiritimatiellia bacterium]